MKKTLQKNRYPLLWLLLLLVGAGISSQVSAQIRTVTIGSTTSTASSYMLPINNLYGYTYSQQVVLASELGPAGGIIGKMRFYYNTGSLTANNDWTVYLGYKTTNTFSSISDWVPLSNLTQVYSGTVTATGNWIELTFSVPFVYLPANGNLVIAVDENSPSYTYTTDMFKVNSGTSRSIYYRSDGTNPSPAAPPTANSVYDYFNTMQFDMSPLVACTGTPAAGTAVASPAIVCLGSSSALSVTGASTDTGTVYQWQDSIVTGTWQNIVGATTFSYTTAGLTANRYFRRKITCAGSGLSGFSAPVLVSVSANPLPYYETFESITATDQLPGCMTATSLGSSNHTYTSTYSGNQTNHTPGGSKFGLFNYFPAGSSAFVTPAMALQAGKSYLFTYWVVAYANNTAPFTSITTYYGTTPTIAGLSTPIGSIVPTNTTYTQISQIFTPTTTDNYYIGIVAASTGTTSSPYNYYVSIDDIGLKELVACTGKPVAGTISPVSPCPNQSFTLRRTGGTSDTTTGNLTFLWQDSTASGWLPSAGIPTNPTYTSSLSASATYRVIVTCTNSGLSDTSASYRVTLGNFLNCYCVPTYASGGSGDNVTIVTLKNMTNNTTAAGNVAPYYTSYTTQQPSPLPIPSVVMGQTDTVKLTFGTDGTQYSAIWIDFDHSGTFDASEFFTTGTAAAGGGSKSIPFTTPLTALPGLTRLRVRGGDDSQPSNTQACNASNSSYGEGEDYFINIQYPPCSGPLNAGVVVCSDSAICIGYPIDLYNTTHATNFSQISWSWQSSNDNGLSWNPVAGSANKDSLLNIIVTGAVQYRLKMICDNTGDSTFSAPAGVRIKLPYQCYCYSQSNGGTTDSSDIGAVVIGTVINSTGGPHILNPAATRRRSDYTYIPNIVLNANNTYRLSVYHIQRNGNHADARVSVFMDYNNDLVYNAAATPNSERVYTGVTSRSNFYIDTFITIPNAVIANVPTGMRVILNNDLNPSSPANLGCGPYVSGETEDYVIMFRNAPQGVNGVQNLQHVSLYPNPTSGKFQITAGAQKNMDNVEIAVTTITGQVMMRKAYQHIGSKFSEELDLSEAARGIYFVELKTASGDKMVQKLIVR